MTRTQSILAGLLVVQVLLIVALRAPWSDRDARADARPLLPALADADPGTLEIDGDGDAAVTLVRGDDDWGIRELGGFPARAATIEDAIETLRGLTVRRPIATNARYHETFEVGEEEHAGRVRLWSAAPDPGAQPAGDPLADLIIGSSTNYRALHVRRAGEDDVYEVTGLSAYDLSDDPATWAETELVSVGRDDVVGVRLSNEAGSFALERGEEGWRVVEPADLAGREPAAAAMSSFLGAVTSLRLAEPTGPVDAQAQGFSAPAARLALRHRAADAGAADGDEPASTVETVVLIGGTVPDDDSRRFATRDGFGFAGEIWGSSVAPLLERTAAELLAADDD